jgi:hypothetical protein
MVRHLPPDAKPKLAYEGVDVNPRSITRAAGILFSTTVLAAVVSVGFFVLLARRERAADPPPPPLAHTETGRQPPAPRLQAAPLADVASLHREEEEVLSSYGWVDEGKGIARVPIEEAMRLYVERARSAPASPVAPAPPPSEQTR